MMKHIKSNQNEIFYLPEGQMATNNGSKKYVRDNSEGQDI